MTEVIPDAGNGKEGPCSYCSYTTRAYRSFANQVMCLLLMSLHSTRTGHCRTYCAVLVQVLVSSYSYSTNVRQRVIDRSDFYLNRNPHQNAFCSQRVGRMCVVLRVLGDNPY